MKFSGLFWYMLVQWISLAFQAEVDEKCVEPQEDTQCFTVKFGRSVFEGADEEVKVNKTAKYLLLSIYSNTPTTGSLKGYTVSLSADCPSELNTNITQLAPDAPQSCQADLVECSRSVAGYELVANGKSVKNGVFYAQIRIAQRTTNFDLHVQPMLDDDEQEIYSQATSGFTPVEMSNIKGSVDCTLRGPEALGLEALSTSLASMAVLGVCLVLAAVASRIYALRGVCGTTKDSDPEAKASLELNEAGPSGETSIQETKGSYVKQPL